MIFLAAMLTAITILWLLGPTLRDRAAAGRRRRHQKRMHAFVQKYRRRRA